MSSIIEVQEPIALVVPTEHSVPTVVIKPGSRAFYIDLPEMWEFRELIYFMILKDVKTRYKQAVLGVAWVVLQPVLTTLMFVLIFSHIARVPSEGVPYPLFAFAAMVPWTYFAQSVNRAGTGMVGNANLISKVYFPRLIIPLSSVFAPLVDITLAFITLFLMMTWYEFIPPAAVVFLPAFILLAVLSALALGLWLSALNVRYRDVQYLIPFFVQTGMLASPVAYPVSLVPAQWQTLYCLNPMVAVIEGVRWSLLGTPPPTFQMIALACLTVGIVLISGLLYFNRTEKTFADII